MKTHHALFLGVTLALASCVGAHEKSGTEGVQNGQTGLAIAAAANSGEETDVALMRYSIDRIACEDGEKIDPLNRTLTVRLENMMLPGGIPAFENSPLDNNSAHPFADHFEVVPAGCYNLKALPLTKDGALSADCAAAWASGVTVVDGETTEVFLISQCKGTAVGAVDTTVALNQPPTILELNYQPSKFIRAGDKDIICVTAGDPNGDPIAFSWAHADGPICDTPRVISAVSKGGSTTECVELMPKDAGSYSFEVRVYDLLHDDDGNLVTYEQWLRAHGYPNDSHDSLKFPLYVGAAVSAEATPSESAP
jgi:hypothetical protein